MSLSWAPQGLSLCSPYTLSINICEINAGMKTATWPFHNNVAGDRSAQDSLCVCGCFFLHPRALRHNPLNGGSRRVVQGSPFWVLLVLDIQFQNINRDKGILRDRGKYPHRHWTAGTPSYNRGRKWQCGYFCCQIWAQSMGAWQPDEWTINDHPTKLKRLSQRRA